MFLHFSRLPMNLSQNGGVYAFICWLRTTYATIPTIRRLQASTHSFVGLEPLKQQFLRFAKTAILNQKRKQLGFQVEDMSTQCLHLIFQGNPGTKTTFARKVAGINRQVLLTATTLSRTCCHSGIRFKFKYNE